MIITLRGDNMKKLFLLVLLLLPIMVYAEDYDVKTLIPVDTKASVKTEKFDYNGFVYNSKVDSKGNGLISFDSIKNNTVTKQPVSINILLFDEDQKNIGYLTYCTDKDLDSNYSAYKLNGNTSAPFSIKVISKYFVEGKSATDVKYISVLDENKYCQIGGYDKYKGLTLDEIVNGAIDKKEISGINKLIVELQEKGLMTIIVLSLAGLAVLIVLIMILRTVFGKLKEKRLAKAKEVSINAPMEETVNLTYGNVDNNVLDDDESISMGEVNNTVEEKKEEVEEKKEEGSDLTNFFN